MTTYILTPVGKQAVGKPAATLSEITETFAGFIDMVKVVITNGAIVAQSREAPPVILGFIDQQQK